MVMRVFVSRRARGVAGDDARARSVDEARVAIERWTADARSDDARREPEGREDDRRTTTRD